MHGFKEFLIREMAARKQTGRLVNLANRPDAFMAVISAKRSDMSPAQVKAATQSLKQELGRLREFGFGFTPTTGGYQEGDVRSVEPSFVVSFDSNSFPMPPARELVKTFVDMAERYQQMGVLIKLPGQPTYEYTTRHHEASPNTRIPYHEPTYDPKPMYFTRPRYRGVSPKSTASPTDGLTFSPDFDRSEPHSLSAT